MTDVEHAENWLILTDYASKHKISVSTLRRRIKNNSIHYKFEDGRYLIGDSWGETSRAEFGRPSFEESRSESNRASHQVHAPAPVHSPPPAASTPQSLEAEDKFKELGEGEPIISTATRLLNELKLAYSNILHEKEEQMIQLKEEVSDLKTLVRVLESDNDRMRAMLQRWGTT